MTQIKTKEAYYGAMAEIEKYLQKGFANLSSAEDNRLEELSAAAEAWEKQIYPMPVQASIPDVLTYVMRQYNINQNQISDELAMSRSLLSEILNGKKKANVHLLKSLHARYKIDGNMLLELA